MGRHSDRDYAEQDSSPHVRGCSAATGFRPGARCFFPAYAGVIRWSITAGGRGGIFPSVCGGDPIEEQKKAVRAGILRTGGGNPYAKSVTIESPALSTHGQGYRRALQAARTEAASRGENYARQFFAPGRRGGGSTAHSGPRGRKAPHSQFANNSLENRKQRSGRIGATRERSQRIWRGSSCKRKTSCP